MAFMELLLIFIFPFATSILFFGWVLFWHLWITGRPYRDFPSYRLDADWLLKLLTGQLAKNVSFTKVFFQEIIKKSQKFYEDGVCVLWMFRPYLLVYNEDATKILANEPAATHRASDYEETLKDAIGNGIIGSNGKLWRDHRKLMNPVFTSSVVKCNMLIINQNAKNLVNEFQSTVGKPTEDMLSILKRCTFEILAASIFDLNVKEEGLESKTKVLIKLVDEIIELITYKIPRPWLEWRYVSKFSYKQKKYKEKVKQIRVHVNEIIDELIMSYTAFKTPEKDLDNEVEGRRTLSQVLIKQHFDDPTFTKDYLIDNIQNFLVTGYDTVAYSLMWCLYILGHHPEVQNKACNEIESLISGKDVTYDDLGSLKYLDCIIKESLRLYTTIPIYGRKVMKDIRYGKYTIPKYTEIAFFPFLLHRNPNIYPEPTKFKPERFADSSTVQPWMHVPFGGGYRNCIGKKFAMMEMKVLLVHLLREFQIKSLDTVRDEDLDWEVTLKTTKPLRMLFETRPTIESQMCHKLMNKESRAVY